MDPTGQVVIYVHLSLTSKSEQRRRRMGKSPLPPKPEQQGRMSNSWEPSPSVLTEVRNSFPHVHPLPVVPQFRDYFMDPSRNRVRARSDWDRTFLSWCGRREEQWLENHTGGEEEKFDDVTGMPRRTRSATLIKKSPDWWRTYHALDPEMSPLERMRITDEKMGEEK